MSAAWERIDEAFHAAVERTGVERAAYLRGIEQEDPALYAAVRGLLDADASAEGYLETPVGRADPTLLVRAPPSRPGDRIGAYRLIRLLGQGGMAHVFLAERMEGEFRQQVAIKLMSGGAQVEEFSRRFARERQLLADLQHPHIAHLLDGGTTPRGIPYLVMEYVDGEPMDRHCRRRGLGVAERLGLFRQVCDAVHFAHQNLIVHRDLKCGNILVTPDGQAKLLDFGIAKILQPTGDAEEFPTRTLFPAMTPIYASPEQMLGGAITTASDVYSLGVTLYYLLTDKYPLDLRPENRNQWEHFLREQSPITPSVAARRGATRVSPGTSDGSADPNSRPPGGGPPLTWGSDLDQIVIKALHKEPSRRYASVEQFSDDLDRYLRGLPVRARPDSFAYRANRFVRRNRWGVLAGSAAIVSLIMGFAGTWTQAIRAKRESVRAERQRELAVDALYGLVFGVQEKLWGLPGTQSLRADLLSTALQGLQGIVETSQGSSGDHSLVVAHQRLGDIESEFGHLDQAKNHFQSALKLAEALHRLAPALKSTRGDLATSLERLGDLELNSYRALDAAREHYTRARALRAEILGQDSNDVVAKCALAAADVKLGRVAQIQGDEPTAAREFQQAFVTFDSIPEDQRTDARLCRSLAVAYSGMCASASLQGRLAESRELAQRGLDLIEQGMKSTSISHGTSIAMSLRHQMGLLLSYWGEFAEARREFQLGRELGEKVLRLDPDNRDLRRRVAVFRQREGEILMQTLDLKAAEARFQEALDEFQALSTLDEKSIEGNFDRVLALTGLADLAARQRNYKLSAERFAAANDILMSLHDAAGPPTPLIQEYQRTIPLFHSAVEFLAAPRTATEETASRDALGPDGWRLYLFRRGVDAVEAGEACEAVRRAEALLASAAESPGGDGARSDRFTAAAIWGALTRVRNDEDRISCPGMTTSDLAPGERAMELLRELLREDRSFLGRVYPEPELRAITLRADFQQLFAELAK